MKRFFTLIILILAALNLAAQGYQVSLQTPSYTSGIAYLTYHMGPNLNIADSGVVSDKGQVVFKGKTTLLPGIYSIVFPGKTISADFLIDKEQVISIKADITDLNNMTVTGSKENVLFQEYQKYVAVKGKLLQAEKAQYNAANTKADSVLHEANYTKYNKELTDYRDNIAKTHPQSMMALLLNAMKEPPYPTKVPVTHQDSLDNYYYYRSHYWDGVSFMDARIIRTPFFLPKLERYYREVLPQASDSIIKDLDYKLLLARTAPEMYKFLLNWFTDEYINPKYMGQDAIFVHLFNKYHSKGVSSWLNEKQMDIITRRAYMQMSNLIGEKAANLEMVDSTGKPTPLYGVEAPYTVVIFWDPTCGHCKEEVPRVDSIYKASWKEKNVKIYAVLTEDQKPEWIKYTQKHELTDWIHVYETKEMAEAVTTMKQPGYRQLYDVISTPTLYLLDKDKRIIGKKLTWKQLNDLLLVKMNTDKKPTQ